MIGDIYIAANPRKKFEFSIKITAYPKDEIVFVGTKNACEKKLLELKNKRNEQNKTNQPSPVF